MGHHRGTHEERIQGHRRSQTLGHQSLVVTATLCGLAVLAACGWGHSAASSLSTPSTPELWYYHHSFLASDEAEDKSRKLIDQAVAAGYTGLVLWDSSTDYLGSDTWPPDNEDRMRSALRYAVKKHLKVNAAPALYGFSNETLEQNPNWAESQRVIGTEFVVDPSGQKLYLKDTGNLVKNPGFEDGQSEWFDTHDRAIGISGDVRFGGKSSAVVVDAPGNARFHQSFPVKPWHQYHIRLFFQSANFTGGPMISVFDGGTTDKLRLNSTIAANGNHKWTELDYIFNSGDSSSAQMYFGVWGGSKGSIWFDDVTVEETAFVYLTRRSGTPLKIYSPGHLETTYREGTDVKPIVDPRMQDPKAFTDDYHAPPVVSLAKSTRLKPGDIVAIDYYAAFPIPGLNSISMCMTEPGTFRWIERNGRTLHHVFPKGGGIILGYDEIRQANSCESCRAKKMTAGQLLAWSVGQTIATYDRVAPGRPLYIWNDMFDPHHNAHSPYYYVEGDLQGSWEGVPSRVAIMNWNLDRLHDSLSFFAGRGHQQMIAGYYDSGNGAKSAADELQAARGVPGLQGVMYTTWSDDYGQLKQFADTVKAGWTAYLSSLK